jgi:hypothetical protein
MAKRVWIQSLAGLIGIGLIGCFIGVLGARQPWTQPPKSNSIASTDSLEQARQRFQAKDQRLREASSLEKILQRLNSAQMISYSWGGFSTDYNQLGFVPEAPGYRVTMKVTPEAVLTTAQPMQAGGYGFSAGVFAVGDRTLEIRCRSLQTSQKMPKAPRLDDSEPVCPAGMTDNSEV